MYKNNSKYTQSTLSKFDIIGSYFVNLFYNEFYNKSVTLKANGTYSNITEAYTGLMVSYLDFIKKPEFFKQIIRGIHMYCISTTKYTSMTHKECIEFMVREFIPEKLWNALRESQKNKLFHEVMGNCITVFIENIIKEKMHIIIDNHKEPGNVIILQDMFLNIILLEKDKIYSKFLNPNDTNTISVEVVKNRITEILNQKKELINERNILLKSFNSLKLHNDKNIEVITNLQTQNRKQQEEIKRLNNIIMELKQNENKFLEIEKTKHKPIDLTQSLNTRKPNTKKNITESNEDTELSMLSKSEDSDNEDSVYDDELIFDEN